MGHSSTDPLVTGTNEHPRDFSKVFHSYGSSTRKSTHQIIECWDKNPTWPELTILGKSEIRSSNNVKWIKEVSIHDLREFQRNHSIHLCPSTMEGFGHYINEARGNGAVVLTTDYGPMNEFVQDGHSGILVEYANTYGESNELIATVYPIGVTVHSAAICKGVERIFSMSLKERELMGDRARNAFLADRAYFQMTLKQLKKEAESFFEE